MASRTAPAAALILADDQQVDALDVFETTRLRSSQLRPNMLLVDDELGTAVASLDHRVRGSVWLIEVLDRAAFPATAYPSGRWIRVDLGPTTPVATRPQEA